VRGLREVMANFDFLPTLEEVEAMRRGKPIEKSRPRALDKKERDNRIVTTDRNEDKKVKQRSGGRCEVVVVNEGRCHRNGEGQPHHMLGGWGRRARGRSALAEHKQHCCGQCHRAITNHTLRLVAIAGELPMWSDKYERVR
jgi:hypothetical protein